MQYLAGFKTLNILSMRSSQKGFLKIHAGLLFHLELHGGQKSKDESMLLYDKSCRDIPIGVVFINLCHGTRVAIHTNSCCGMH